MRLTDQQLIELYRSHGIRTPHHVPGAFAFVLHDPSADVIMAGRDPVGTRPLYFQRLSGAVRIADSLVPFADRRRYAADLNDGWLAQYLEGLSPFGAETAFEGVIEVLPGQVLWIEAGVLRVSRWHTFAAPPVAIGDPGARLASYRHAVLEAASSSGRSAAVELGMTLGATTLLAAASTSAPESQCSSLWGVGLANFDRTRDGILADARRVGLAGADLISGWPGLGTAWQHWYRTGAQAVGQPSFHTDLMFQSLLDCLAGSGRSLLLAGGNDWAFGWEFRPRPAQRSEAPASVRAMRAARNSLRALRTRRAHDLVASEWQPGPFINPAIVRDLDLPQLAEAERQEAGEVPESGYAAWTRRGLVLHRRERLTTWYLLGRRMGIDVEFPLFDPDAIAALLALPRELNDMGGMPGRVAQQLLPAFDESVDWRDRRWAGTERQKTPNEYTANGAARRAYLRQNLHPRLEALLNMNVLGPRIAATDPAATNEVYEGWRRRQAAVEFAHIEAANHWLETWSIS